MNATKLADFKYEGNAKIPHVAGAKGFVAGTLESDLRACQTLREAQVSFAAFCKLLGLTAHNEEEAVLNAGREFLPRCAIKVLDGGEPTLEYYEFLTHQVRASREGQR